MDKLKVFDEFNTSIKSLARVYVFKKKGTFDELKAIRNNKRLNMLISSDPLTVMKNSGPFLWKYKDDIKERKWDKLVKYDFDKEIQCSAKDKKTQNVIGREIEFIKSVFSECTDTEKESLGDHLTTMLSAYVKYLILMKKKSKAKIRR